VSAQADATAEQPAAADPAHVGAPRGADSVAGDSHVAASAAGGDGGATEAGVTEAGGTRSDDAEAGDMDGPRDPWNDPRLPWEGKPRRVDIACWAAITLSGIYYLVLLPFRAPLVGSHPLLLEALNGSTEAIVSAAASASLGHGSLAWVLLAAIPGLMKFDLIYWWAGRLWGERVIGLFTGQSARKQRRAAKFAARVHRWGWRFTWPAMIITPFLPIPNAIVYAVTGWAGMGVGTFLILDAIGTLAWTGMLAGLGYALGQSAVSAAQAISRYGLWISIGIVALIFAGQLRSARAQR
jgi:membrane protein DedA with SNARE-associated domain